MSVNKGRLNILQFVQNETKSSSALTEDENFVVYHSSEFSSFIFVDTRFFESPVKRNGEKATKLCDSRFIWTTPSNAYKDACISVLLYK